MKVGSKPNIVTNGDSELLLNDVLCKLKIHQGLIDDVMNELIEMLSGAMISQNKLKLAHDRAVVLKKSNIIIGEQIDAALKYTKKKDFSKRRLSREQAARNREKRKAILFDRTNYKKHKSDSLKSLEELVGKTSTLAKPATSSSVQVRYSSARSLKKFMDGKSIFHANNIEIPRNGKFYTIQEVINFLKPGGKLDGVSCRKFHDACTSNLPIGQSPLLICSLSTLKRKIASFRNNGILPLADDEGVNIGRPPLISNSLIDDVLNAPVRNNSGKVVTIQESQVLINEHTESKDVLRGVMEKPHKVSLHTVKFYDKLASNAVGISRTKISTSMNKNKRRQTAQSSIRNCLAQASTMACTMFEPGVWTPPEKISKGAFLFWKIVCNVYNMPMRPKKSWIHINSDATQYWAYVGAKDNVASPNQMGRCTTVSLERDSRGTTSVWKDSSDNDKTCNGLCMKWQVACGSVGALLPLVGVFSGLSNTEMPEDGMLVAEIPGLCPSSEISICNDVKGYFIFIRRGTPISEFHAWYDENIIVPFVNKLRKEYGSSSDEIIYWIDSDIPHLKHLENPAMMERSVTTHNLIINKVGAKTTGCCQTLDVGDFFRRMKVVAGKSTLKDQTSPLKSRISKGFDTLRSNNQLLLPQRKLKAIIDIGSTAPQVFSESFKNKEHIKNTG